METARKQGRGTGNIRQVLRRRDPDAQQSKDMKRNKMRNKTWNEPMPRQTNKNNIQQILAINSQSMHKKGERTSKAYFLVRLFNRMTKAYKLLRFHNIWKAELKCINRRGVSGGW